MASPRLPHVIARASLALVLGAGLLTTGCATNKDPMQVLAQAPSHKPIPLKAIVTDFEDKRKSESRESALSYVPLMPYGVYHNDRHDKAYGDATEPFQVLLAKNLAERLQQTHTFAEVTYVGANEVPARGQYDVLITGRLDKCQAKGAISRYGLSIIGDLLWYLGAPYYSRRWDIDATVSARNGFTGQDLFDPVETKFLTTAKYPGLYADPGKTDDLASKALPTWDTFIKALWDKQPGGDDPAWASLHEEGLKQLAREEAERKSLALGTPATINFTSPTEGSTVRTETVPLAWNVNSPNGLRKITLLVNGQDFDLPYDAVACSDVSSAPKSLPTSTTDVRLKLGANTLVASVSDHRGNKSETKLNVNRLPKALSPERRFAFLVGCGDAAASVGKIKGALEDPLIGQFDPASVAAVTDGDAKAVEAAFDQFAPKPQAGDFVVLVISGKGSWKQGAPHIAVGGGAEMPLADFLRKVKSSLATEDVLLVVDADWDQASIQGIPDSLRSYLGDQVPLRWAVVSPSGANQPNPSSGFADAFVSVMKGNGSGNALTLDQLIDRSLEKTASMGGKLKPESGGRYNAAIVMAEYK